MPKKPTDVFTPRSPEVNEDMYVARPDLEKAFKRALEGSQHILVHGESGSGKSWLYRRTLRAEGAEMFVANLANASRLGSIAKEIESLTADRMEGVQTSYSEGKSAEVSALGFGKGGLAHSATYAVPQRDPLEVAFAALRKSAGDKRCCLVLDNLETIFSSEKLMSELGEIVVLLDDTRYAQYRVKLVIVGVPSGVRQYFSRVQNRTTVANRIEEVPEVASLTPNQLTQLVRTGFKEQLAFECSDEDLMKVVDYTQYVTSGIPQMVHEFCLQVAYLAADAGDRVELGQLEIAAIRWLNTSLTASYTTVESMMNERNTVAGRRNQVLYALGLCRKDDFGYRDIEEIVRAEFPESTEDKTLNISGTLTELGDRPSPLIRQSSKTNTYSFTDPKYRMCLRVMLTKEQGRVGKIEIRKLALGN